MKKAMQISLHGLFGFSALVSGFARGVRHFR